MDAIRAFFPKSRHFLWFLKKSRVSLPLPLLARLKGGLWKMLFLKILQYSQKSTSVGGFMPATLLKESLTQVFSFAYCKIFKNTFWQNNSGGDCFWKLNLKTVPNGDSPILCKKAIETVPLKSIWCDCYQLAGNGTLLCKMFYLLNFMLFYWICFT